MDVICTDWFIYNITEHINTTTDLYNLKCINKYYSKQITKQYMLNIINKNISKSTNIKYISYFYILTKNLVERQNHMFSEHLTIPRNTLYEVDIKATPVNGASIKATPVNEAFDIFISSKIRNVSGKLDICELNHKENSQKVLEYRIINNVIRMVVNPTISDEKWFISMKIKSTAF
jgi:prolyl oligopeptidase PreP (S9A serine peptidase family)